METVMPAKSMADSADRFCSASAAFLPPRRRTSWWYIVLPSLASSPPSSLALAFILPSCSSGPFVALPPSPPPPPPLPVLSLSRSVPHFLSFSRRLSPSSLPPPSFRRVTFRLSRFIYLSISLSLFACTIRFGIVQTDGITFVSFLLPSSSRFSSFVVYASRKIDYTVSR